MKFYNSNSAMNPAGCNISDCQGLVGKQLEKTMDNDMRGLEAYMEGSQDLKRPRLLMYSYVELS